MAENLQNELRSLIGDVKEQVTYLKELGVNGLEVEMPQTEAIQTLSNMIPAAVPALEKPYVPSQEEIQMPVADPVPPPPPLPPPEYPKVVPPDPPATGVPLLDPTPPPPPLA